MDTTAKPKLILHGKSLAAENNWYKRWKKPQWRVQKFKMQAKDSNARKSLCQGVYLIFPPFALTARPQLLKPQPLDCQ